MSTFFSLCLLASLAAVTLAGCYDKVNHCGYWAGQGYCSASYVDYMEQNCKKSCGKCGDEGGDEGGDAGGDDDGDNGDGDDGSTGGGDFDGSCGKPSVVPYSATSSYIVGGKEAAKHSIPWQISVQTTGGFHFCGASIVNKNWVVTAAHCVDEGDNIKVLAGAHSKSRSGQKYRVERIYKHKQYNSRNMQNDIAMLQIGGSGIAMSDAVMPVCLPSKGYEWQTGQEMMVSGWGTLRSSGKSPDKLQQVTVPLVEFSKCARQNGMSTSWKKVICAGLDAGGKDSCQGDSGGPLVGKVDDTFVLAGVVSWGYGCAKAGYPGVYTHVSHYIDWMNGIMKQ